MQKRDLYQNQFSNKKGAIAKPESPKKHPIWAAHPRTHLSIKYPPPPGLNIGKFLIILGVQVLHENVVFCVFFFSSSFFFLSFNVYSVIQKLAILECENVLVMFNARVTVIYIGLEVHFFRDKKKNIL